jgi:enterochelin esterase family protein
MEDTFNDNSNPSNPHRNAHMHSEAMVAALQEKGYDMTFVYGEGTHADDHTGSILPDILRWLWRDYPK